MARNLDLNDVRLLMQVIEHGSYTAASRAIGVPKSTISQRITALEVAVGTGLLRRTSRSFSLTEAGTRLLPHARAIEDLARKLEQDLVEQGNDLGGTLRISCSIVLSQFAMASVVPRFLGQHSKAAIRVEANNRLVDLVGEGFDMVVRAHASPLKDSSLMQRVVARTPWLLCASPAWVEHHGVPSAPDDLPGDQVLCFSATPEYLTLKVRSGQEQAIVPLNPRMVSDDMITLRDTAIADGGIACVPNYIVGEAIHNGQLLQLLPDWSPPPSTITVLTPPRAQSSRLAHAFSDYLAAEMPSVLQGPAA